MITPANHDLLQLVGEGCQQRNQVPPFSAINEEVSIGGEHLAAFSEFGHAHQTGVGKTDGLVSVFSKQLENVRAIFVHDEIEPDNPALNQGQNRFGI
jgi:hypothetical protein